MILVISLSLPCVACDAETLSLSDENRVVTTTVRVPATTDSEVDDLDQVGEKWVDVAYFDGLGRPTEEVAVQAGPGCQGDI